LAVIVIIGLALAAGGGTYYKAKKAKMQGVNATTTASVSESGTLRSLLSLGKDVTCTFSRSDNGTNVSGMVYVDNPMLRGDFVMMGGAQGRVESHMVRMNNDVYVWMGNQGAKLNISDLNKATTTQATGNVSLDSQVNYECRDWTPDQSKFTLPSGVNFYDMKAMMQAGAAMQLGASFSIKAKINTELPTRIGY
jgi:hypothetical protein